MFCFILTQSKMVLRNWFEYSFTLLIRYALHFMKNRHTLTVKFRKLWKWRNIISYFMFFDDRICSWTSLKKLLRKICIFLSETRFRIYKMFILKSSDKKWLILRNSDKNEASTIFVRKNIVKKQQQCSARCITDCVPFFCLRC